MGTGPATRTDLARVDMDRKKPSDMTEDASALAFSLSIREALEQWLRMRREMRVAMEPCKHLCLPWTKGYECSVFTKKLPKAQIRHMWPERQRQPTAVSRSLRELRVSLGAPGFAPEPLQVAKMPVFPCQSPSCQEYPSLSPRSGLGRWAQQWHTDLCGKGLSCRVKSQNTRLVVPPLMMESLDSTCWVIQKSPAENSNSSPE